MNNFFYWAVRLPIKKFLNYRHKFKHRHCRICNLNFIFAAWISVKSLSVFSAASPTTAKKVLLRYSGGRSPRKSIVVPTCAHTRKAGSRLAKAIKMKKYRFIRRDKAMIYFIAYNAVWRKIL